MTRVRSWKWGVGNMYMQRSCAHRSSIKPLSACGGCYAVTLDALLTLKKSGDAVAHRALETIRGAADAKTPEEQPEVKP